MECPELLKRLDGHPYLVIVPSPYRCSHPADQDHVVLKEDAIAKGRDIFLDGWAKEMQILTAKKICCYHSDPYVLHCRWPDGRRVLEAKFRVSLGAIRRSLASMYAIGEPGAQRYLEQLFDPDDLWDEDGVVIHRKRLVKLFCLVCQSGLLRTAGTHVVQLVAGYLSAREDCASFDGILLSSSSRRLASDFPVSNPYAFLDEDQLEWLHPRALF